MYRTGPTRGGAIDGDLVLVASGDPNLSGRLKSDGSLEFTNVDHSYGGLPLAADPLAALTSLARQLAAKHDTRVNGRVLVDASLFCEDERELGTVVTMSPAVVYDKLIDIVVTPGAKADRQPRVGTHAIASCLSRGAPWAGRSGPVRGRAA